MGCQFKYWVVTDRVLIDFLDLISYQLDMDRWFVLNSHSTCGCRKNATIVLRR